jgi:hypothetical protein
MTKANHARRCRRPIAFLACSLLSVFILLPGTGCSGDKPEPTSTKVVETNADPNVFTMQNPNQFALTSVQVRKVSDEVHVNCAITPDVNLSVPVVSLGGGMVVEIKSKLGDYVKKGQVLLLINSPDLTGAFRTTRSSKPTRSWPRSNWRGRSFSMTRAPSRRLIWKPLRTLMPRPMWICKLPSPM